MTTRPRVDNSITAAAITSRTEARSDLFAQADLWALHLRGGNLYAITGHSATVPTDDTVVASYADVDAFDAAVDPGYDGDRCRLAGWPHDYAITKLEGRADATGTLYWEAV